MKKFLARPEGSTADPTNKTRRAILPNELERATEAAKRAEDGRQRKRAAAEEAAARKTKAAKTEAATAGDGTSDVTAANTCSRADDQDRDTPAKNDDGQVAVPTERDGEGDVEMGSTGSRADDQERGEVEANEQASGGAAAATVGAPKKKKKRRGTSKTGKGCKSQLAKQRQK